MEDIDRLIDAISCIVDEISELANAINDFMNKLNDRIQLKQYGYDKYYSSDSSNEDRYLYSATVANYNWINYISSRVSIISYILKTRPP
mgnify:FL=1